MRSRLSNTLLGIQFDHPQTNVITGKLVYNLKLGNSLKLGNNFKMFPNLKLGNKLGAKGFKQVEGLDFFETFEPSLTVSRKHSGF